MADNICQCADVISVRAQLDVAWLGLKADAWEVTRCSELLTFFFGERGDVMLGSFVVSYYLGLRLRLLRR